MLRKYNETLQRLHMLKRGVEYAARLPKRDGLTDFRLYSAVGEERHEHVHRQAIWGVNGLCGTYACRLGWALYLEGLWDPEKEMYIQDNQVFRDIFNSKFDLLGYFGLEPNEMDAIFPVDARDDDAALAAVDAAITRHERALQEV